MISIMVIAIGIIITSRFVYLDTRYNAIILSFEKKLNKISDAKDQRGPETESLEEALRTQIVTYRVNRNENRSVGFKIDLFSMSVIMLLGFVAVFGLFEGDLALLSILLASMFAIPPAYFVRHLRMVNRISSV